MGPGYVSRVRTNDVLCLKAKQCPKQFPYRARTVDYQVLTTAGYLTGLVVTDSRLSVGVSCRQSCIDSPRAFVISTAQAQLCSPFGHSHCSMIQQSFMSVEQDVDNQMSLSWFPHEQTDITAASMSCSFGFFAATDLQTQLLVTC